MCYSLEVKGKSDRREKFYSVLFFLSLDSVRVVAVAVSPSLGSLGVVSSKDNQFLVGVPAVCWVAAGHGERNLN